jgi:hypothetical protein
VHYAIPHAYAAFMAKQMLKEAGIDIPVVTTLHGSDITLVGNHPFYKPAVTFSINNSDVVTAVSKDLRGDTFSYFGVHKEIHVVPNFINVARYDKIRINCERNDFNTFGMPCFSANWAWQHTMPLPICNKNCFNAPLTKRANTL